MSDTPTQYDIILTARVECADYEAALQLVGLGTLALSEAYNIDTVTGEVQHVCSEDDCGMEQEYDLNKPYRDLADAWLRVAALKDLVDPSADDLVGAFAAFGKAASALEKLAKR